MLVLTPKLVRPRYCREKMSLSSIVRSIAFAREFFSATLETEARVWVHILKTVGAALIAMGL